MRARDLDRFCQLPYDADAFDCADLVALVQREVFGREVRMPSSRPRGHAGAAVLGELSKGYATQRTGPPEDGDLVLMFDHGQKRPGHAGVFFRLAHEEWVLHSNERNGCSVLHRVRELPSWGLRIEGIYQWA